MFSSSSNSSNFNNPSQGQNDVFPIDNTSEKKPLYLLGVIGAISMIQQYYVMENNSEPLPEDYLTLDKKMTFFYIGFSSGFLETLLVALLSVLLIPILADPHLKHFIIQYFPLFQWDFFIVIMNYLPIFIFGGICCYLSKYRVGCITQKAIDQVLLGRIFSMALKAIILFMVMIWLSEKINKETAWSLANTFSFNKYEMAVFIYRIILNMKPALIYSAFETFFIFIIAMLIPFFTVWLSSAFKTHKQNKLDDFWEN